MRPALIAAVMTLAWLAASLPAGMAQADTPLDAESFESYTTGQTLTFTHDGVPYGAEQYLPGRRVIWAFAGEECEEGVWYPRGDMICFAYETYGIEQCWNFYRTEDGLRAVFQGPDGPSTELYEAYRSATPLMCEGPEVGV